MLTLFPRERELRRASAHHLARRFNEGASSPGFMVRTTIKTILAQKLMRFGFKTWCIAERSIGMSSGNKTGFVPSGRGIRVTSCQCRTLLMKLRWRWKSLLETSRVPVHRQTAIPNVNVICVSGSSWIRGGPGDRTNAIYPIFRNVLALQRSRKPSFRIRKPFSGL